MMKMKQLTMIDGSAHNLKELDIDFECMYDAATLDDAQGVSMPGAHMAEGDTEVTLDDGEMECSGLYAPYEVVTDYDIVTYARNRNWTAFGITEVEDDTDDDDDEPLGWTIVGLPRESRD
jgi:hypothetical protein